MRFLSAFAASSSRGIGRFGKPGDRLVDPLDPFGRVEPPVAQFYDPAGFQGYAVTAASSGRQRPRGARRRSSRLALDDDALSYAPSRMTPLRASGEHVSLDHRRVVRLDLVLEPAATIWTKRRRGKGISSRF